MRHRPGYRLDPPILLVLAMAAAVLVAACSTPAAQSVPAQAPASPAAGSAAPATAQASAAPATEAAPAPAATSAPAAADPLPDTVTVTEAAALREAGAFVLDVRQPEEWAQVRIPGATLIPLGELPGRLAEVPQDRDVVVVCRAGNRSQAGRDILRDAGYPRVTSMAGGIIDWRAAGLPVEGD